MLKKHVLDNVQKGQKMKKMLKKAVKTGKTVVVKHAKTAKYANPFAFFSRIANPRKKEGQKFGNGSMVKYHGKVAVLVNHPKGGNLARIYFKNDIPDGKKRQITVKESLLKGSK